MSLKSFPADAEAIPVGVDDVAGTVGVTPTFTTKLQWLSAEKSELKPAELVTRLLGKADQKAGQLFLATTCS